MKPMRERVRLDKQKLREGREKTESRKAQNSQGQIQE